MPEVVQKYFPLAKLGADKEGSPVWILKLGKCDYKGILNCIGNKEMDKHIMWSIEYSLQAMKENSKKFGKHIETHYYIFDIEGLTLRQVTCRPVVEYFRSMTRINDNNYPETLKKTVMINASQLFTIGFALVKPFVHENTLSKFAIYGTNDWKEALLEDIDAEVLPVHWGGTRTDGSGKPWCPDLVPEGGDIPSEFLKSPSKKLADVEGTEVITVSSGSAALVEADIELPGAILKWAFGTDGHDIAFGVYRKTAQGLEEHVPKERVTSHLFAEEGELECIEPGTYVLAFDNAHSMVRSKTVTFRVEVLPPDESGELSSIATC